MDQQSDDMSNEKKHTPGPWKVRNGGGHKYPSIVGTEAIHTNGRARNEVGISSASYSEEVCEIHADLSLPGPEATARLIAAAPELLEALKYASDYPLAMAQNEGFASEVRALLAKATGAAK